jgi:hypothetical protein
MFGDGLFPALSDDEYAAVVSAVESRLEDEYFREGSWVVDYRRLRFRAVRV